MYQLSTQGISMDPMPDKIGEHCRINYEGLLKKSGADQVFLHYGYGASWNNTEYLPMYNTDTGGVCDVSIKKDGLFSFCFKDSADHWDNNSGQNWTFMIKK